MWRNAAVQRAFRYLSVFLLLCFAVELVGSFQGTLLSQALAQDAAAPPPQESMLVWTYKALGIRYTVAFFGDFLCVRGAGDHELSICS